jgi:DNA repair protein RadC
MKFLNIKVFHNCEIGYLIGFMKITFFLLSTSDLNSGALNLFPGGNAVSCKTKTMHKRHLPTAYACAVKLSHNHLSRNLNPSEADLDLTKKMKEAGRFLEVSVLEQVIMISEALVFIR